MNHGISAVAMDFDGVLTDGSFCWGIDGSESKRLSFRDVMGISLGMKQGLRFAIVSGEDTPLIDRYAAKMGITDVFKGCRDKRAAVETFAVRHRLELGQIAFVGDDVNDLAAMAAVGLSATPADAHPSVRSVAGRVLTAAGGHGAIREFIDDLLDTASIEATKEGVQT